MNPMKVFVVAVLALVAIVAGVRPAGAQSTIGGVVRDATAAGIPGVTVAGVDVGSLTRASAEERLRAELDKPWSESVIVARADGRTWTTTNGALAVRPDMAAALDEAFALGKTGTLIDRLGDWADALRGGASAPMTLKAQGYALERWPWVGGLFLFNFDYAASTWNNDYDRRCGAETWYSIVSKRNLPGRPYVEPAFEALRGVAREYVR